MGDVHGRMAGDMHGRGCMTGVYVTGGGACVAGGAYMAGGMHDGGRGLCVAAENAFLF